MIDVSLVEHPRDPGTGSVSHELKFVVPASVAGPLSAWVSSVCQPDTEHPPAKVSTVYFDTPDLAMLSAKIDSDHRKTKVRVRWYGSVGGSTAFAEVKRRLGSRREKDRVALDATATDLQGLPLWDPRWPALLGPLRAVVPALPAQLTPVLALSYTRQRFVDAARSARVTIDADIRATALNIAMVQGHAPVGLDRVVFEYKGPAFDLPRHLRPLVRFGARRQAFSKYLACYQAVTGLVL
jgi:hypothetical protein